MIDLLFPLNPTNFDQFLFGAFIIQNNQVGLLLPNGVFIPCYEDPNDNESVKSSINYLCCYPASGDRVLDYSKLGVSGFEIKDHRLASVSYWVNLWLDTITTSYQDYLETI